jgi:hypothetical protein
MAHHERRISALERRFPGCPRHPAEILICPCDLIWPDPPPRVITPAEDQGPHRLWRWHALQVLDVPTIFQVVTR